MAVSSEQLAIFGGPKAITRDPEDIFAWPLITAEDEQAVLEVLRSGRMSGNDVSKLFEREFADWIGSKYALTYPNGTESLRAAMWAVGTGAGDEIICPSMTYWASAAPALTLGAAVNFADIDPETLCIDPADIEHRIGPRTRAIVVVHYAGHPADMDRIMSLARAHGVAVIEDVSHAHGSLCHGRKCGTIGDVAAMSLMSGKSFPAGEGGILVTDNREIYERCIAYGFYERTGAPSIYNPVDLAITDETLRRFAGVPLGGYKHRLNQLASAMGRVQLRHYPRRISEIQAAMNRFWDLLEGTPGIRAHRPTRQSGSTMGGWYHPRGLYRAEELGGLLLERFTEALRAEGFQQCQPGANLPLHAHPVFHEADVFNMGAPTVISFGQRDVRQGQGSLPVSEGILETAFDVPWFKKDKSDVIEEYAAAFRKVAANARELGAT